MGRGGEGDIIGGGGEHREQVEGGHWRQDLQLESYLAAPSPGLGHWVGHVTIPQHYYRQVGSGLL